MTPRETLWADVVLGGYVVDRNGRTWLVEDQREGQVLLKDAAGERRAMPRPDPFTEVTVMEPTPEEALAIVQDKLGAEVIGTKEPGRPWQVPPLRRQVDEVHRHTLILHGVWTGSGPGSKSIEWLLEQHRNDHLADKPASHAYVPHEHRVRP